MVATPALGAGAEKRMGSSPFSPTEYFGGLLKLVKRMLLKSIRSVMSWRGGSNPSTSACGCTPEHNGKPLVFVINHIIKQTNK